MRGWLILLVLSAVGLQAHAARISQVSIDEFEKILAAAHGQSDAKVAHQVANLELTERVSSARLARWEAEFPGRHCHEILTELADSSVLLDLPASEILVMKAPDSDTQRAMIEKTFDYAARTINRLPNFSATRVTHHFEDTPAHEALGHMNMPTGRGMRSGSMPAVSADEIDYQPMHSTGVTSIPVTYRDGTEVSGSKPLDAVDARQSVKTLSTAGEFGPVLGMVLEDARDGRMAWSHWEQGPDGVEAVFHYSVPSEHAHYMVRLPRAGRIDQFLPPYHGEIAIDPAKGDVMRISVVAELAPPYDRVKTAIAVEYGTVMIGAQPYTCPIKSIAISRIPVNADPGPSAPMQTQLNDVTFTGYHLFRAESRIVTGPEVENEQNATPEGAPAK